MTPEQTLAQLKELDTKDLDLETQHSSADIILYQFLIAEGHTKVAEQYKDMMRNWWYA